MGERRSAAVITVGGKGSSLSSSSVDAIACGLAQVRIDSSALDRLSSTLSNQNQPPLINFQIPIPETLSLEETRASLTVLLCKLLKAKQEDEKLVIRAVLPVLISETLNSQSETIGFESVDVTEDERVVLEKLSLPSILCGICSLLDYKSSALSSVIDVVAALSCEASGADVAELNLIGSGDEAAAKEEIGVAGDLKVLLNGSKLVGKMKSEDILKIPKVIGRLRAVVKSVHSSTRVELKSSWISGTVEAVGSDVQALATRIYDLGNSSLSHVKMNLSSVSSDSLRNMFEMDYLSVDSFRKAYRLVLDAKVNEDYVKLVQDANLLLGMVWKIVTWEAVIAFIALEGGELFNANVNGGDVVVDKKSDKKKKKVVLGKGTGAIVVMIKEHLQTKGLGVLQKCVEDLFSFFDPREPEFVGLVAKVEEIVGSNESRRLPKLPKGTRDFAREQMVVREKAFSIITKVFKRHGAMALDTPEFELRETLMGKYGEDSKLIYDLADQGGELCSLRYDLTVPFARYVAMNRLTSFKRYQIAKVFRRDNPSKGRYREFYQCDFDIAGQFERMGPDFEVVKILTELLDELDIGDYEIKLNHRLLLDAMLEICGVPSEKFRTICSSIDKLDKQSFEQIKKEMVEEKGLSVETVDRIGTFVKERGSPLVLLSKLKKEGSAFLENNSAKLALDDLEILFQCVEKSKCIEKVVFDLSLARGLDYYTGVIFEAVFKGATQVGSIAAGGRYDNLIGMFGTKQVPAVGVSLGIERVFTIMEQIQKDRNQTIRATETQVLAALLGDELPLAAELVNELWSVGVNAEYMANKKVMKLIDRAKESKVPWMVIVGERELKEGIVKLKNIETKAEEVISRSNLVEELKKRLNP